MIYFPLSSLIIVLISLLKLVGSQQAFGSVSLPAIQRICPHATDANAFALAKALNNNIGKYSTMRSLINQFFKQDKFGKPKPKTLSLYDNSTYSKAKLISLVNNRQAVTNWWVDLTTGFTKIYNAATATKYKNLYAYFDSRNKNSYDYTIVYFMLTVVMKESDNATSTAVTNLIADSMETALNNTPSLAFVLYTTAFEANHNQTYMKGVW